jgi:hypothetical protein
LAFIIRIIIFVSLTMLNYIFFYIWWCFQAVTSVTFRFTVMQLITLKPILVSTEFDSKFHSCLYNKSLWRVLNFACILALNILPQNSFSVATYLLVKCSKCYI